ncbi:MAG: endonuclease/exonuclease/phosphatase family protein, partial [Clostridia bacterium]|nr:endonuclease/exonuclease/phosphatase family protein [Clostridia bacterium]
MSEKKKPSVLKTVLKAVLCVLGALVLIVGGYLIYVFASYHRIPDNQVLTVENRKEERPSVGGTYTILTYNIGMGIYSPDFGFFMDGGTQAWGNSKETVLEDTEGALNLVLSEDADFVLLEEVATGCTCNYGVNQLEILREKLKGYSETYAVNYDSPFLFYPLTQPFGAANSGLAFFSRYEITESVRRSLPIETGVSKFLDLDRCYSVNRIPLQGGGELVIFLLHLSAYTTSGTTAEQQIAMLLAEMQAEYNKGNYVIAGGDWNKDMEGNSSMLFGFERLDLGWTQDFDRSVLPAAFSIVSSVNPDHPIPTCRNADGPYDPETQYQLIVDGFIVSRNIEVVSCETVDTSFRYSDHNP